MELISINDEFYPKQLLNIPDAPKKIYALGNLKLLNTNAISIIGSRSCSNEGYALAKKFARELALQGLTIVSGLAKGIDRAAHEGALEVGGNTIAVLGNGFNKIFPKENIDLYNEIVKNSLVMTEYGPNERAQSKYFLERNRIVSGLSRGVLVVEAAYRSGTSVTASLAKKQGREIFCIPHAINDKHGVGTNKLIAKGAKLITNTREIIESFYDLKYDEKKLENINVKRNEIKRKVKKEYQKIYEAIGMDTTTKEEICYKTKKQIKEVNAALLILEIEGYVKKVAGGYKCVINK